MQFQIPVEFHHTDHRYPEVADSCPACAFAVGVHYAVRFAVEALNEMAKDYDTVAKTYPDTAPPKVKYKADHFRDAARFILKKIGSR